MIGIFLNDNAFEQDIRELLMAFYPGEGFWYGKPGGKEPEEPSSLSFAVEGIWNEDRTELDLHLVNYGSAVFFAIKNLQPELEEELLHAEEPIQAVPGNRTETKNRIKRRLYALLMSRTGRQLPWGALTGIRPTKKIGRAHV